MDGGTFQIENDSYPYFLYLVKLCLAPACVQYDAFPLNDLSSSPHAFKS
jgi:hypothetical protein